MAPKGTELAEALGRIRDADQRAEYHARRALEWTERARRGREEMRRRIVDDARNSLSTCGVARTSRSRGSKPELEELRRPTVEEAQVAAGGR